jgi:hypothetical protein
MWKFLHFCKNLEWRMFTRVVHTKGDDIDFQRGGGCGELNRADLPPSCCYLPFPSLRLEKREKRWLISSPH